MYHMDMHTSWEVARHTTGKNPQLLMRRTRLNLALFRVCAYANNQWDLDNELNAETLQQTSFARAMARSKGTVLILDKKATSWTRIWYARASSLPCV